MSSGCVVRPARRGRMCDQCDADDEREQQREADREEDARRSSDHASSAASTSFVHSERMTRAWVTRIRGSQAKPVARVSRLSVLMPLSRRLASAGFARRPAWNSTSSRVTSMNASSSEARIGVSSCSTIEAFARRPRRSARPLSPRPRARRRSLATRPSRRAGEQLAQARRLRASARARGRLDAGGRTPRRSCRRSLAAADHDQVLGGQRHLAHQVRGDKDRAALRSRGA
jgi:hypothetical protein